MAALVATLTPFDSKDGTRVYQTAGHSALKPRLVIQKRKVPTQAGSVASMVTTIVRGTEDAAGLVIASKVAMSVEVRFPIDMGPTETDLTDALTLLKDVVASDEFAATLTSQGWIKG